MTSRERTLAILGYEQYDRVPIVYFWFWCETLQKWHAEGHITEAEASNWSDGMNPMPPSAESIATEMLSKVGIPGAEKRIHQSI